MVFLTKVVDAANGEVQSRLQKWNRTWDTSMEKVPEEGI